MCGIRNLSIFFIFIPTIVCSSLFAQGRGYESPVEYGNVIRRMTRLPRAEANLYFKWAEVTAFPGDLRNRVDVFLQQTEKSIACKIPVFWADHVKAGGCDKSGRSGFVVRCADNWKTAGLLAFSGADSVTKEKSSFIFRFGLRKVALSISWIERELGRKLPNSVDDPNALPETLTLGFDTERGITYVAPYYQSAHLPGGVQYLIALNPEGNEMWRAKIDCGVVPALNGSYGGCYSEIVVSKGKVHFFGIDDFSAFFSKCDCNSGDREIRFCSSHVGG